MSNVCAEFDIPPSVALRELEEDPEWWAVRLLPVRSFLRQKEEWDRAVELKTTHKVSGRTALLIAEVDAIRLEMKYKQEG